MKEVFVHSRLWPLVLGVIGVVVSVCGGGGLVVVVAIAVGTGIGTVVVSPCSCILFIVLAWTFHFVCMSAEQRSVGRRPAEQLCERRAHAGRKTHRATCASVGVPELGRAQC